MVTLPWQPQHANSPFPDTDTEAQRVARHLRPTAGDTQAQGTWLQDLGLHPAPPPQATPAHAPLGHGTWPDTVQGTQEAQGA